MTALLDPQQVLDDIARDTNDLDRLSKAIFQATAILDEAEDIWLAKYDAVLEALEEEFAEAGRKHVPEHTAVSAARRAHRDEWTTYRRAKRAVERLQQQLQAKRAALSGRQSNLNALRDEARAAA
jgi:chromosome segregation ATPase